MIGILITTLACGVIAIIGGLIIAPLNAITNGAAVNGFFNALSSGLSYVYWICDYCNFIIPVNVIFICVGIIIAFRLLSIVWNWVEWVVKRICEIL